MSLNLKDLDVIHAIMDKESRRGFSKVNATTTKEIQDITGFSNSKIRSALGKFKKLGWVDEGVKDGLSKCYYVTVSGLDGLDELTDTSEDFSEDEERKEGDSE